MRNFNFWKQLQCNGCIELWLSLANQSEEKFSSLGIYLSGEGRDEYKEVLILECIYYRYWVGANNLNSSGEGKRMHNRSCYWITRTCWNLDSWLHFNCIWRCMINSFRNRRAMTEYIGIPTGDKLILRGLKFHGFHGVKPEEKKLGQKFLVDVDAWMDLRMAGKSDLLSDTVSYTDIYRIVKEVVEGQSQNLLESVAQLIASTTLTKYPQISAVRVKVGKPHVAVHGPLDYLGVEIIRYRSIDAPN
ncbi:hypothetical protein CRYUN_Cryun29cG0018100 [Craigia yunnanensis]